MKLLLISAVVVAAPIPALAQAWPTTVVAGGPRMAMTTNTAQAAARVEQDTRLQGRANSATQPPIRLKLTRVQIDDVPVVEIEPRAEWFDDQGWRVSPTRVAFKRRF